MEDLTGSQKKNCWQVTAIDIFLCDRSRPWNFYNSFDLLTASGEESSQQNCKSETFRNSRVMWFLVEHSPLEAGSGRFIVFFQFLVLAVLVAVNRSLLTTSRQQNQISPRKTRHWQCKSQSTLFCPVTHYLFWVINYTFFLEKSKSFM